MFFRIYRYGLKCNFRQKEVLFWSLAFPIILGTLFFLTFGGYQDAVSFQQIPVASVEGQAAQPEFTELLEELENSQDLIKVQKVTEEKAKELLKKGEVEGIYFNGAEISLMVSEEGISQSILKSVSDQYGRMTAAFSNIAREHPEGIAKAAESLNSQWNYIREKNVTGNEMNNAMSYFHALIAMSCMYGCFMGVSCAVGYKANLSDLGARRTAASTNRMVILLADVLSSITVQFLCTTIGICYLKYVLNVALGNQMGHMLLVVLAGCTVGVLIGMLIGCAGKLKENTKDGLAVLVSMVLCFLAGLMVGGMYQLVERTAPLLNRINPASLVVKALYSLNLYEGYERYTQSLASLLVLAIILMTAAYLMVRRERYASI